MSAPTVIYAREGNRVQARLDAGQVAGARSPGQRYLADQRNTYLNRVPLQKSSSFAPSDAPWERFSELGTYRTCAFQPRGLRPRSRPLPLPLPTAGGYSSRSKWSLVG